MTKILLVKTSSIGDIIQCFDLLTYLHHRLGEELTVDWVVEKSYGDLVESHPLVDRVIHFPFKTWLKSPLSRKSWQLLKRFVKRLRLRSYDLIVDLQGNWKSSLILFLAKGERKIGFSKDSVREKINLFFTDEKFTVDLSKNIRLQYISLLQQYWKETTLPSLGATPLNPPTVQIELPTVPSEGQKFLITPGSRWPNKQLSNKTLSEFLHLVERRFSPFFLFSWGSREEREVAEALGKEFPGKSLILPKMTLSQLADLIQRVDLVIAMDSAVLHLAGAQGVPTFSIFGPTKSSVFKPLGEMHGSFEGICPYQVTFIKQCPLLRTCKTGACIKEISSANLFHGFVKFYKTLFSFKID